MEYLGSVPGLGRSPGEGKGYPLQCPGLENTKNCIVHGFTKRRILSDFHLDIQWLGLLASTAVKVGSLPGQGTKILHTAQHGRKKDAFKVHKS